MRVHVWMKKRKAEHALTILILLEVIILLSVILRLANLSTIRIFVDVMASLTRITISYFLALGAALLFALLMYKSQPVENVLLPAFDLAQSVPGLAILPLAVLIMGKSNATAIFIIFLAMFWTFLFTILGALKGLKEELSEAATIFGAKGWNRFLNFTLPALLPTIAAASIVSWGAGWEIIIAAEIIGLSTGIGAFLNTASEAGSTGLVVVGIIVLATTVFIINKFVWLPLLHKSTKFQTE